MNEPNQSRLITRAAGRASERLEYLGWVFARHEESEQKTGQEMADMLGASLLDYHRMRLCLRPRVQLFVADVQQIVARFGVDASKLARLIRHVEAIEGMKAEPGETPDSEAGLLLAARARHKGATSERRAKKHDNGTKS